MRTKLALLQNTFLLAIFLIVPAAAHAQYYYYTNSAGIWVCGLEGDSLTLMQYKDTVSASAVTIPDVIDGLPVTSIGPAAFNLEVAGAVTSVTIPDTVTTIEANAFAGSSVTNVLIANSVTNIGEFAFSLCALSRVLVPGSVSIIGQGAFQYCTNLQSAVLANGFNSVANYMFFSCSSLTNVNLPFGLTAINQYAFSGCLHVTNMLIPGTVTTIAPFAFQNTISLQALYFLGNAPPATNSVFQNDNPVTNYYQSFTSGWTNTFDGMPTATWVPPLPAMGITTYSNQPIVSFPTTVIGTNFVVRTTTNLASGNWTIATNGTPFIGVLIPNAPPNAVFQVQ